MFKNLFICGCGHSGTSLLLAMFSSHPDVYGIEIEMHIFKKKYDASREELLRNYETIARKKGKKILCEKTPRNVYEIDKIFTLRPTAKVVIMVRNPLDVAASLRKRKGNMETSVDRWINDNMAWMAHMNHPHIKWIKYEDLVREPKTVLQNVCDFLSISFSEDMLNYHENHRLYFGSDKAEKTDGRQGKEHVYLRNWQLRQPIMNLVGEWRSRLSTEEYRYVLDRTGGLMTVFGYEENVDYMLLN